MKRRNSRSTQDPLQHPALKNGNVECSDYKSISKKRIYCNGFFEALHHSFVNHCGFEFVPDHIWLLICQGISSYESKTGFLGKAFNLPKEKKEIIVKNELVLGSSENDWTIAFEQFENGMKENVPAELYDLLSSKSFSTSTKLSQACFSVCFMDSLKKYLSFRNLFKCDIPLIKISGTKEDWENLFKYATSLSKVEGLQELEWWFEPILCILQKFVDVFNDKIDTFFWRSPYRWGNTSGSSHINGWTLAFFPVLNNDTNPKWKEHKGFENELMDRFSMPPGFFTPLPGTVPNGINNVPFIWEVAHHHHPYNFYAGFLGMEIISFPSKEEKNFPFAKPRLGWAVGRRPNRNG